jgi:hypothetical protein
MGLSNMSSEKILSVLIGLFVVGVVVILLPSLHAQQENTGYPTETTRVYYESDYSDEKNMEEYYLEFTSTARIGKASVGEKVNLEVTITRGESMGVMRLHGVLTTEEGEIIAVETPKQAWVMAGDSLTINITTTLPEDLEGSKLLFKGHASSDYAPQEEDIDPSPDKDSYLQLGQVTREDSESGNNDSEYPTDTTEQTYEVNNYTHDRDEYYQTFTVANRIGTVSVGDTVTTELEIETGKGMQDKDMYGLLVTEKGEIIERK